MASLLSMKKKTLSVYRVLQLSVRLCSSFPRGSGKTRGWARKPGPQAERVTIKPVDQGQRRGQPATIMPGSWRGSSGHAATGKRAGGGQSLSGFPGQKSRPGRCLSLGPGILRRRVIPVLTSKAPFLPPCPHTSNDSSLGFALSAAHSEHDLKDFFIKQFEATFLSHVVYNRALEWHALLFKWVCELTRTHKATVL